MRLPCALAGLVLASCGVDSTVELGMVRFPGPMIEAPTSPRAQVPFQVRVNTHGGDCVSFERTDVELTEDGADILVYDRTHHQDVCLSYLIYLEHEATLVFDQPGPKTVRIHARKRTTLGPEPIVIPLAMNVE